jgi:TetR/AcrR family transcriptional regulator, fatty acid metabolism regulator protein
LQKIEAMINFQFTHFTKYPAVIMLIFAETSFQYNTVLSKAVRMIMEQKQKMVSQIIESGQQEGSIRNDVSATQLTTMIMGSMRLTVLRWKLSNFDFDLIDEGKELWKTIEILIKKD